MGSGSLLSIKKWKQLYKEGVLRKNHSSFSKLLSIFPTFKTPSWLLAVSLPKVSWWRQMGGSWEAMLLSYFIHTVAGNWRCSCWRNHLHLGNHLWKGKICSCVSDAPLGFFIDPLIIGRCLLAVRAEQRTGMIVPVWLSWDRNSRAVQPSHCNKVIM